MFFYASLTIFICSIVAAPFFQHDRESSARPVIGIMACISGVGMAFSVVTVL